MQVYCKTDFMQMQCRAPTQHNVDNYVRQALCLSSGNIQLTWVKYNPIILWTDMIIDLQTNQGSLSF